MALRRHRRHRAFTLERQPDGLPKSGLFAEPIRITRLDELEIERLDDGERRVVFMVEVRDAEDKRCSDVAVEAHMRGPQRASTVSGTTDLLGRVRFRMAGPPGSYEISITDVGAHGLVWDRGAGPVDATTIVAEGT